MCKARAQLTIAAPAVSTPAVDPAGQRKYITVYNINNIYLYV